MSESKRHLRQALRDRRDRVAQETREIDSQQIIHKILSMREVLAAETLFVYVSFRSEVQTHGLLNQLLQLEKQVCVPFVDANDQMQAVPFVCWDDMQPDHFGVLVPKRSTPTNKIIETSIVPGLGFTTRGARLGYGKGYYDRFLAIQGSCTKIGVAFDCQIVEQMPTESFDCAMDYVVTEKRTLTI